MSTDPEPPTRDELDPSQLSDGHRALLAVLAENDWADGCTALELTYLLGRWRFPMESTVNDVTLRVVDLADWGLVDVVDRAPDWPAAAPKFRIADPGRERLV